MTRTFLELMQAAADELGIPQPSSIIGSVDDQSRQLLALANREGKDFSVMANSRGGWSALHKEYVFETNVLTATTGNVTSGSAVITNIPDTTGITAEYFFCDGEGLPYQAKVLSVDSSTQVTLDRAATESGTGVSLTFAQGAYALPADFEYFVNRTTWEGTIHWELLGPISAQEKQALRYGVSPKGPRRRWYVRAGRIWLDPVPSTDAEPIAFDYFSNHWCQSSGGATQSRWAADTDTYKLDEDCFIQGIKWRFLRSKGLDYGQEKLDYDADCMRVLARDGGSRTLPLGASNGLRFLSEANVPDTGYGE